MPLHEKFSDITVSLNMTHFNLKSKTGVADNEARKAAGLKHAGAHGYLSC